MGPEEIRQVFTYHAPNIEQRHRYHSLRQNAKALALHIQEHCPESWEKSLAITKVREAVMWANASIACHE